MIPLNHPLFRIIVFCLFAALLAVACALHAHAADIPTYDQIQKNAKGDLPLDRPSIEIAELLPWVAETAQEVYDLKEEDYEGHLKDASAKFTKDGWKGFTTFLAKTNIIAKLKSDEMVVTLIPGKPVLLAEGVEDGVYHWMISVPCTINYWGKTEQWNDLTTITVKIIRVPAKENMLGFQIDSWDQT
jgi:hypothetical protein